MNLPVVDQAALLSNSFLSVCVPVLCFHIYAERLMRGQNPVNRR